MSSKPKRGGVRVGVRASEASSGEADEPSLDVGALLEQDRVRQTQTLLEEAQAAYDDLCAEHHRVQEQRRAEEREAYELAALFRREQLAKNEQLAALHQQVAQAEQQLKEEQLAASEREQQLQAEFEQERQQLAAQASALQAQLDGLAEFQQQRDSMEAELARLRQENERIAMESGEKVRALQRRLYELGHGPDGSGAGGDAAVGAAGEGEEEDDLCLEADLHRLLAHNRKIADEMRHYGQEADELQREMKALEAERAGLLRDVQLKEEMEQQYAKRGTLQAREIRAAHTKITSLEKGLAQMAADFEQEKAALEQALRGQLADAVTEQNALRRLLQIRTKELRQVRQLAQEVLLQRSDVEAFLVSSIQQVRTEMAAAHAQQQAQAGDRQQLPHQQQQGQAQVGLGVGGSSMEAAGGATSLGAAGSRALRHSASGLSLASGRGASLAPAAAAAGQLPSREQAVSTSGNAAAGVAPAASSASIADAAAAAPGVAGSLSTSSSSSSTAAGQVDIRQLGWEDRERILRLLFAKINRAAQRPALPASVHVQHLSESQMEVPAPPLRGLATEAGPAGLA